MTTITGDALIAAGYREHEVRKSSIERYDRLYQKCFKDKHGKRYYLNFRLWGLGGRDTFDANLSCDTATGGTVWLTIKEETIEATEQMAAQMWETVCHCV